MQIRMSGSTHKDPLLDRSQQAFYAFNTNGFFLLILFPLSELIAKFFLASHYLY